MTRSGKALESAIAAATVLELGARGKLRAARGSGAPSGAFRLAGRVAVRSDAGAIWNEWTLAFDDGSAAFLAEARGTFTVFVEASIAPAWDALVAGAPLDAGLVVVERGQARRVAVEGDADPGPRLYRYADLSAADGEIVTFDYGEATPRVFRGRPSTLRDLGLAPRTERPRYLPVSGFPVQPPEGAPLFLALGDEGTLDGTRWRVIAQLARSVEEDGERFGWREYLLHDPARGFRWLVESEGHWSFVESVEAGMVRESGGGASYEGEAYKPLSSGEVRLDWAAGELPWEVFPGDTSQARDYVRAPHLLSREATTDEVVWSRASYLPTSVLAKAFGKRLLPKPRGRAPHAPKK